MDKRILEQQVGDRCRRVWHRLQGQYSELGQFDCPQVKINARLYRTAGRCFQDLGVVEFGKRFFEYSPKFYMEMINVIVPHELIHQADFYLHGASPMPCGHGATWQRMMRKFGLEPNKYHDMWIPQ